MLVRNDTTHLSASFIVDVYLLLRFQRCKGRCLLPLRFLIVSLGIIMICQADIVITGMHLCFIPILLYGPLNVAIDVHKMSYSPY